MIKILEYPHVWDWCRARGILDEAAEIWRLAADPSLERQAKAVFAAARAPEDPRVVADSIVEWTGEWSECLVWITAWGVWPSSEDWPEYYAWRGRHGTKLSIDDAPGHLAKPQDREDLRDLVTLIVKNGWDAWVIPSADTESPGARISISHDGWAELLVARVATQPES